jgi:very-short-patch-repair endonuclease
VAAQRITRGQELAQVKAERARELRGAMTPAERLLWAALRTHGLEGLHFRRQQVIDGFIVDFYCSAAALIIEVDGSVHAAQRHHDAERDHIISARGLRILRISNDDVLHHLPATLERISTACGRSPTRAHRDRPSSPSEQLP